MSLRDKLIAVAAFAYALYLLQEAGDYARLTVEGFRWGGRDPWFSASDVVATLSLLGQSAGFVVLGVAFAGRPQPRARRVLLSAYCVGGAYACMFLSVLVNAPGIHGWFRELTRPDVVTMLVAYFAAIAATLMLARAYTDKWTDTSAKRAGRRMLLGWASACFGVSVALTMAAIVLGDGWYALTGGWVYGERNYVLFLAANAALALGAVLAASSFFLYNRIPDWAREARYAGMLALSAAAIALYGVIVFARSLVSSMHLLTMYPDSWRPLLGGAGAMAAGFCLSAALVVVYRAVPAPVNPETIAKLRMALPQCPQCGSVYNPADYRQDAAVWLCGACRGSLRSIE